MRRLAAHYQR